MKDAGVMTMVASEDVLVPPEAWREHLHPRRGGWVRPFAADPQARAATDQLLTRRQGEIATVLAAASTSEAVRAAATRWLAGDPVPAGAAAVAAIAGSGRAGTTAQADVWISEYGLRFAALAAVEMASLLIIDDALPPGVRFSPAAGAGIRHRVLTDRRGESPSSLPVLLRVRAALASASEDDFEQVVASLTAYRAASLETRIACSVLSCRPDWVEQDVADLAAAGGHHRAVVLLHAAGTPEQADVLGHMVELPRLGADSALMVTLADGVGAGAAPMLFRWFDDSVRYHSFRSAECVLSVLAQFPGDDVMRGLLSRSGWRNVRAALLEAAERFPARAVRILAEEDGDLLRVHVARHLDLVDEVMPLLSPAAAGRVRAVVEAVGGVVVAPLSAVPPVLAEPPWQNRTKTAKPPVVAGLTCTDTAVASWLPGERQQWAQTSVPVRDDPSTDWPAVAEVVIAGTGRWNDPGRLFTRAPEEIALPALARWQPRTDWDTPSWLPVVAARFGADALPVLLTLARSAPAEYGPLLMPFTSPAVATLMADWSARLKSVRRLALRWLLRHPAAAARALIPAALGKAGADRRQAGRALLLLHSHGRTEHVRAAAAGYGPDAAAGVEKLLGADPLMAFPARMPSPPQWAEPGALPPVRLRDGSGALPAEAVANLVRILMISRPDEPYAGLEVVRRAVEPSGLAAFGWALFELWQSAGEGGKDGWVLDALAVTGDDEVARRLTPLLMSWPAEGLPARAVTGLSVLVGIGTDEALLHLHRISQRVRSTPLGRAAAARITDAAERLGLTADQLADRLIPDFGLDTGGSLRLDYGPRQFVVGFDEQLRPFVTGADGKRLKALPKPGARDDAELGEAAYRRFSALKRDVRKISAEQVRRLEQAMVGGRRWTGAEFRRLFVEHPLMWHIGRRLVWSRHDDSGTVTAALRIAEDRSFAGVGDDPVALGEDDLVGVAHPLHLGEDTARWAEIFADYEILQPFPQIDRPVYAFTEAERAAGRLDRFEGVTVPTTRMLTLDRRGWQRQEAVNAGIQPGFDRPAGPGRVLTVHLDPGIVGQVGFHAEQKLVAVYLHDGSVSPWELTDAATLPLAGLDPVVASEILRDLTDVTT